MTISVVRFQIYFFSTVLVLLQFFITSTESFNCDDKNAVYCLVKYLRENTKGGEGRMKTENGWQWVIKKSPSDENDVNVQWKNWTTTDNRTGYEHNGEGPCVKLCLSNNNEGNNSLEAGQGEGLPCSKLLCKLLSHNNCTNDTTTDRNSVSEPDYTDENKKQLSSLLYHKKQPYTIPLETTMEPERDETYSTATDFFKTFGHSSVAETGTEPSTPTVDVVESSIQLYGSDPMYSMKTIEFETTEGIEDFTTTPFDTTMPSTIMTQQTTTEPQFSTTASTIPMRSPTIMQPVAATLVTRTSAGLFEAGTQISSTVEPTSKTTLRPKVTTQRHESSTSTELTSTMEDSSDYLTIIEPSSSIAVPKDLLIKERKYHAPIVESRMNPGEEYEEYSGNEEEPGTTTEYVVYQTRVNQNPQEQIEVENVKDYSQICLPQENLPVLLAAYDSEELQRLRESCECCSLDFIERFILGFLEWYNKSPETVLKITKAIGKKGGMMYNTKLRPIKHKKHLEVPEVDEKYVVKNMYSAKPRNNYRSGVPKGQVKYEARGHSVGQKHYRPEKEEYFLRKHYSFESPPDEKEDGGDDGVYIVEYSQPEDDTHSAQKGFSENYEPNYVLKSSYGFHGQPEEAETNNGEFLSIYDDSENYEKIRNPYAKKGYRYIIIKDHEGVKGISEDILKKIHGRQKVQYVILDHNNHTRNIDLHKIFEERFQQLNPESFETPIDTRILKVDDNAIRNWFDKKYTFGNREAEVESHPNQNTEPLERSESSEENPRGVSLYSEGHETPLRRRISRNLYADKELHEPKDSHHHSHHVTERPAHVHKVIVENDPKTTEYDEASNFFIKKLVKREVLKALESGFYKPHYYNPPTRKQQHVRKNLNSFEEAYLRSRNPAQHHGHNPKSDATVIAELQHSGGIRGNRGWHSIHQHGVYPDKVGLQIVSDLQKIRKNQMLVKRGIPLKLHETTPKTIDNHHKTLNHGGASKVHTHPQLNNNNNDKYTFYEVYPHSNYYSSVINSIDRRG